MAAFPPLCSDSSYKLLQCGIPYCIFRNKGRHQYGLLRQVGLPPTSQYHLNELAATETALCLESLTNSHIPSYLLYGSLRRDASTPVYDDSARHVVTACHDGLPLFVHVGGRNMDELFLRDTQHCFAGSELKSPPGFDLPLTQGAHIRELVGAGTTNWGSRSDLLVRTSAEVFHVCTLGLNEWMPTSEDYDCNNGRSYLTAPVILEPVRKWQLPEELCCLASTSSAQWSTAAMLSASGNIYTWTPTDGVLRYAPNSRVLPVQEANNPGDFKDFSRRVECSLHPQQLYLSSGDAVYTLDLRSNSPAALLYTLNRSTGTTTKVLSMAQHGTQTNLLMVSAKDSVQLVDTRFAKAPLTWQFVPGGHEQMSYEHTPYGGKGTGEWM
jgi:hypothetical protein